jgi:hypothetical protein
MEITLRFFNWKSHFSLDILSPKIFQDIVMKYFSLNVFKLKA